MPDHRPVVAVVMLTLNQREVTLRALESFGECKRARVDVLVWDNGSTDGTVEAVREQFPQIHTHHSAENRGVAGGRNAGAAMATEKFAPDYLCFLDNDLILTAGFLDAMLEVLLADASVGQVQAKLRYLDRPDILNDGGGCNIKFWIGSTEPIGKNEVDRGQYDRITSCVSCGGAMMVRAALFQTLGGFDLTFNPFGPEDIDFSLRLQKRGFKALYVPKAMAFHAVSHTFESGGYSATYAKLKAKHWLRFLKRHGSPLQKTLFYGVGVPVIALRMAIREGQKGNFGALTGSLRGMLAARKNKDK